jgi:hypothetical protein
LRWIVLDTNVVVSALLWGGEPLRLLQAGREQRIALFTSTPLLAELTDILARPKFDKKIAASWLTIDQLVDRYTELAALVRPIAIAGVAPDSDDDVVIGTALVAKAELIVTGDRTLRAVLDYRGTRIVSVADALALIAAR